MLKADMNNCSFFSIKDDLNGWTHEFDVGSYINYAVDVLFMVIVDDINI